MSQKNSHLLFLVSMYSFVALCHLVLVLIIRFTVLEVLVRNNILYTLNSVVNRVCIVFSVINSCKPHFCTRKKNFGVKTGVGYGWKKSVEKKADEEKERN